MEINRLKQTRKGINNQNEALVIKYSSKCSSMLSTNLAYGFSML